MKDLNSETVEIQISYDGKTLWINVDGKCELRASGVKQIHIDDARNK